MSSIDYDIVPKYHMDGIVPLKDAVYYMETDEFTGLSIKFINVLAPIQIQHGWEGLRHNTILKIGDELYLPLDEAELLMNEEPFTEPEQKTGEHVYMIKMGTRFELKVPWEKPDEIKCRRRHTFHLRIGNGQHAIAMQFTRKLA